MNVDCDFQTSLACNQADEWHHSSSLDGSEVLWYRTEIRKSESIKVEQDVAKLIGVIMTETERCVYLFAVQEYEEGTPFIGLEPVSGNLEILKGGFLSFDLSKGTDSDTAERIAEFLNDNIISIAYTSAQLYL